MNPRKVAFSLIVTLVISVAGRGQQVQAAQQSSTSTVSSPNRKSADNFNRDLSGKKEKDEAEPFRQLQFETTASGEVAEVFSGGKCDSDGNIYFRVDPSGSPGVRKLSSKGEALAVFDAKSPDFEIVHAGYFSLAPNGDLYQLISVRISPKEGARYVFEYKSNGSIKARIKLDPGFFFSPYKVAPFSSGSLFVAATEPDKDPQNNPAQWPFEDIFSSSGSLLKELHFPDDDEIHDLAASGDERVVTPTNPSSNLAIAAGSAETGEDGNVYLMRRLSPAHFYVVSPGGAIRHFTVDPGDEDLLPSTMHMAGSRIAVLFRKELTRKEILKVVDLEGHDIATYEEPVVNGFPALGPAFVCYMQNPERFTFLTTLEDGKLGIITAHPQ